MTLMNQNFPTRDLSRLAQMEAQSRQNYRPIYSIHRWWARRLGVIFRTIAISLFAPTERPQDILDLSCVSDNECQKDGASGIKHGISYPPSLYYLIGAPRDVLKNVKKLDPRMYHLTVATERALSRAVILDPFSGGGTTLVETNRLGGHVIGYDINPIAWWTSRMELLPCSSKEIERGFERLRDVVEEKLLSLYKTRCSHCGALADAMYVFWVRWINCPSCSREIFLFKYAWLAKPKKNHQVGVVTCPRPSCFHVFPVTLSTITREGVITCPRCRLEFNPSVGSYNRGNYTCQSCGHSGLLKHDLDSGTVREQLRMYAIEFYCARCGTRDYHGIYQDDITRFDKIVALFEKEKDNLLFPRQKIPSGPVNDALLERGFTSYHQLFSKRQLLGLSWLLQAIMDLNSVSESVKDILLSAFSSSLEYHNLLCQYNYSYRKITNLFNHHVYTKTPIPVENNIWGVKYGAGTYQSFIRKIIKAKKYGENPHDRFPQMKIRFHSGVIGARLASTVDDFFGHVARHAKALARMSPWEDRSSLPAAFIGCSSSLNLVGIPSKSIDAVITDPPYYDTIQYSELSNFFYAWLRLALRKRYDWFVPPTVENSEEVVGSTRSKKDHHQFKNLLAGVWRECHRVLKDEGRLVFTFHHSNLKGWSSLFLSLIEGGFVIEEVFPIIAEISYGPHVKKHHSAITHDIIFLCRKRHDRMVPTTTEELYYKWEATYHDVLKKSHQNQLRKSDDFVIKMGTFLKVLSRHGAPMFLERSNDDKNFELFDQLVGEIVTIQ